MDAMDQAVVDLEDAVRAVAQAALEASGALDYYTRRNDPSQDGYREDLKEILRALQAWNDAALALRKAAIAEGQARR